MIVLGLSCTLPEIGVLHDALATNVAVTSLLPPTVCVQVGEVPEQAPPHAPNDEPAAGVAVKVTAVPAAKLLLQVPPQVIPVGELSTVPLPTPALVTVSTCVTGAENMAVTVVAPDTVTSQVPVPPHPPPLQPSKIELPEGVAVSVTLAPLAYVDEHVTPQLINASPLVTVPEPVPGFVTVNESAPAPAVNVAVTVVVPLTVTLHALAVTTVQPVQAVNADPPALTAVNTRVEPEA